ncbi:hypothetical protein SUDANB38_00384 [Streptomyces sp. enrichment culture]
MTVRDVIGLTTPSDVIVPMTQRIVIVPMTCYNGIQVTALA